MSDLSDEKTLAQQLDDAQQRALQYERTARWWNDCCVSWREKWGREHSEKNMLLEELQMLNGRNQALIIEFQRVQAENEKLRNTIIEEENVVEEEDERKVARVEPIVDVIKTAKTLIIESPPDSKTSSLLSYGGNELALRNDGTCFSVNGSIPIYKEELENLRELIENLESMNSSSDGIGIEEKNSSITSLLGRVEGYFMECDRFVQETQREIESTTFKKSTNYNKICSKTNGESTTKEAGSQTIFRSPSLKNLDLSSLSIDDERCTSVDAVLQELRNNIQRLQEENSKEWSLREQSECDLSTVRRELRQTLDTIDEMREESSKQEANKHLMNSLKLLNQELDKKTHELIELKSIHLKTKKSLDNRVQEVAHEKSRSQHYECEMKKLRNKVESIRKELLTSEEKNDTQSNQVRRLQRNLDEQHQLNESLQLQINQHSTRLKFQHRGSNG